MTVGAKVICLSISSSFEYLKELSNGAREDWESRERMAILLGVRTFQSLAHGPIYLDSPAAHENILSARVVVTFMNKRGIQSHCRISQATTFSNFCGGHIYPHAINNIPTFFLVVCRNIPKKCLASSSSISSSGKRVLTVKKSLAQIRIVRQKKERQSGPRWSLVEIFSVSF